MPEEWKVAKITPIHKSRDVTNAPNYRPISLTCQRSKLLGRIIHMHITTYLEDHTLISENQHGFRGGLSTVSKLLVTVNDFAASIMRKAQTDYIFGLLKGIWKDLPRKTTPTFTISYKIRPDIVVNIWLPLQSQTVFPLITQSCICNVSSGVPQDSVLAPLLFWCSLTISVRTLMSAYNWFQMTAYCTPRRRLWRTK